MVALSRLTPARMQANRSFHKLPRNPRQYESKVGSEHIYYHYSLIMSKSRTQHEAIVQTERSGGTGGRYTVPGALGAYCINAEVRPRLEQTLRTCQQARRQRNALLVRSVLSSGGRASVPNPPPVEHVGDNWGGSCDFKDHGIQPCDSREGRGGGGREEQWERMEWLVLTEA